MHYYSIVDNETKRAHTAYPYHSEQEARRAVIQALDKPETVYARFPDKFRLVLVGILHDGRITSDGQVFEPEFIAHNIIVVNTLSKLKE